MPLLTIQKEKLLDELEHGDCHCQRCSNIEYSV